MLDTNACDWRARESVRDLLHSATARGNNVRIASHRQAYSAAFVCRGRRVGGDWSEIIAPLTTTSAHTRILAVYNKHTHIHTATMTSCHWRFGCQRGTHNDRLLYVLVIAVYLFYRSRMGFGVLFTRARAHTRAEMAVRWGDSRPHTVPICMYFMCVCICVQLLH